MTIDEIRWMLELFETRKMSKAAENQYISQPALSQCVQRIEQQLGFRLFERSNKGLNPTSKGQLFYEAAVDITATYQHFLTRADQNEITRSDGFRCDLHNPVSRIQVRVIGTDIHQVRNRAAGLGKGDILE